ncbi:MAG: superoxide dismutase [Mn] [Bacteroidetes bacterium B1(2017)]|nr:MAG: superoxide dismutase [Mn] [Bacteroidetes bacterium B1(2017)]
MKTKTNRKDFIKTSALLGLGALTFGVNAEPIVAEPTAKEADSKPTNGKYELPALGYAYNSLEPFIDAQTMEIHYSKHHQAYINKLNEAMDKEPSLKNKSIEELLLNLASVPASVKGAVRNHGGGHWNHSFFWKSLKTGTSMGSEFTKLATASFGDIENFKTTFEKVSMGVFGSGWVWVILQNKQLKIVTSANQDNPLMDAAAVPEMMPKVILGIDLWEHAYYLKHQNKRIDYVTGFWNVVNWDEIEGLLK